METIGKSQGQLQIDVIVSYSTKQQNQILPKKVPYFYLPMQKLLKISPKISSTVITPVILLRYLIVILISSAAKTKSLSRFKLLKASKAAFSAAVWAANGVLFRAPLNPELPAEAQAIVSPVKLVIVTIVLLKVDWIWTIPFVKLFLFFLIVAFLVVLRWWQSHWH